jgi:O-antigen/teichoic acid export membrane protein
VSFGLASNLLLVPRTFGGAASTTLMIEATRDSSRVAGMIKSISRYLLLVVFPVHLGAVAITSEAIRVTYGVKYVGAIPVLIIASILAMPRAFQEITETLMRAADKQNKLLLWMIVTGVVNLSLDAFLIPRYGAIGAAWGNGLGQIFGVIAIWKQAQRFYDFSFPIGSMFRFAVAGCAMAAGAYWVGRVVPGLPGLILAVLSAAPVYVLLVRLVHGLEPEDRARLALISNRLPGSLRGGFEKVTVFITPLQS